MRLHSMFQLLLLVLLGSHACKTTQTSRLTNVSAPPESTALILEAMNRKADEAADVLARIKTYWDQGAHASAAAYMVYYQMHETAFNEDVKSWCDSVLLSSPLSQAASKCLLSFGMKRLPFPTGYEPAGSMGNWTKWRAQAAQATAGKDLPDVAQIQSLPDIEKSLVLTRLFFFKSQDAPTASIGRLIELGHALTTNKSKGESAALQGILATQWMSPSAGLRLNSADYSRLLNGFFQNYRENLGDVESHLGKGLDSLKSAGLHDKDTNARELALSMSVPIATQRRHGKIMALTFKSENFEWIAIWSNLASEANAMLESHDLGTLPFLIQLAPIAKQGRESFSTHSLASYRSSAYPDPYHTIAEHIADFSSAIEKSYASLGCDTTAAARYRSCPALVGIYSKLLLPTLLGLGPDLKDTAGLAGCPLTMTAMKSSNCQRLSVIRFIPDASASVALYAATREGDSEPYKLMTSALSRNLPANHADFEANLYFNSSGAQTARTVAMDWLCYAAGQNYFGGSYTYTGVPAKFFDPLYFVSRIVFAQNTQATQDATAFYNKWAKLPNDTLYCDEDLAFERPATYMTRRMKEYALDYAYLFPLEASP